MRGHQRTFSPYGGTHDEAPKRKNVAPLALKNAYLWLCLRSHIFQYYGHCYGSFISEGPAPQTERSNSRGGDGPRRLNGERSARAYVEARSKATWRVNSPWEERTK